MSIVNIAAYRFVSLSQDSLVSLRDTLKKDTQALDLKGTILLSTEGINLFLAGEKEKVYQFKSLINEFKEFCNLTYKESLSATQPFRRMLVRIRQEIIPLGRPEVQPEKFTAPHLSPEEFKQWYEEQKEMVVLDTRNQYEIRLGTFEKAIDLKIKHFRDFPNAIKQLPPEMKDKPIVSFCTGGIRCEKAAALMLQEGFKEVYQLEGGILNYFEKCGGAHYQGECFVFDQRVAVDPELQETTTVQCFECREPLTTFEQKDVKGNCPYCNADGELQG